MSIVSLLNVNILNNPAPFTDPYKFEITFECLEPLKDGMYINQFNVMYQFIEILINFFFF